MGEGGEALGQFAHLYSEMEDGWTIFTCIIFNTYVFMSKS
jgi:hypothetical protein